MDPNPQVVSSSWLKPSEIARRGLILNSKGKPEYRFIIRLIKSGVLEAKIWSNGNRPYYMVHIDEIERYNQDFE